MVEQIFLDELEKIFSVKCSHIFTHKGEQLIKELAVKDKQGWKEWINYAVDPNQHETNVCAKVSEQDISVIIRKLKTKELQE